MAELLKHAGTLEYPSSGASSGDARKAVANAKIGSTTQGLQVISHLSGELNSAANDAFLHSK